MQVNHRQYKGLLLDNKSVISKLLPALLFTTDWNKNCKNILSLTLCLHRNRKWEEKLYKKHRGCQRYLDQKQSTYL